MSLCAQENEVHYNPYVETRVVTKYNVTSTSSPTALRTNYESNIFKSMEIDGVMLDELVTGYTFDTTGVHTVKYELYDETKLGIDDYVFYNSNLVECIIPDSVTSIGDDAFDSCRGLTSIVIPDSVTTIGGSAFGGCSGLTSMTVDSNNTVYDSRDNCNGIINTSTNTLIAGCKNTVIPDSVTSIGSDAFYYCTSLTSIAIPSGVTSIGYYAFGYCTSLTSCTIGSGVTSIGERAFEGCSSLTSCTIGSGVTSIGSYAFTNCSSLTSIVSNSMTAPTIQSLTFYSIKTGGTLTVPRGSTGYDVWMGTGNYYLGLYNWTKVEQ